MKSKHLNLIGGKQNHNLYLRITQSDEQEISEGLELLNSQPGISFSKNSYCRFALSFFSKAIKNHHLMIEADIKDRIIKMEFNGSIIRK